jgi:putative membrane protein
MIGMGILVGASICTLSPIIAATAKKSRPSDGPSQTARFIGAAADTGAFQIESGKLAARKSKTADIRHFAEMLIAAHTHTRTELQTIATGRGLAETLPTLMSTRHVGQIQHLKALPSAKFDRDYLDMQIDTHQAAAFLFEDYAARGLDPHFKQFASRTLIAIKQHLQLAQAIMHRASIGA